MAATDAQVMAIVKAAGKLDRELGQVAAFMAELRLACEAAGWAIVGDDPTLSGELVDRLREVARPTPEPDLRPVQPVDSPIPAAVFDYRTPANPEGIRCTDCGQPWDGRGNFRPRPDRPWRCDRCFKPGYKWESGQWGKYGKGAA